MSIKRSDVRLNTNAHRPHRDAFISSLNDACRAEGWRAYDGLAVFLEAAYRSLRGATLTPAEHDKNEAAYAKIVGRCRKPAETMTSISHMLGATTMALEAEMVDFIGPVFEEVAASAWGGQFFTPHALNRLIANLTFDMTRSKNDPVLFCQEPACGVGGMVLASAEVMRERGLDPARHAHWLMVDVDFKAVAGAYIQTTLCGISADVVHGNTLSLETRESSRTFAAFLHPKRRETIEAPQVAASPQGDLFA